MGIRDTSYYGWQDLIRLYNVSSQNTFSSSYQDVVIDDNGTILICGYANFDAYRTGIVSKSTNNGLTWNHIYGTGSFNNLSLFQRIIMSGSNIFCGGNTTDNSQEKWYIVKSADEGLSWTNVLTFNSGVAGNNFIEGMFLDVSGNIYACGGIVTGSGDNPTWYVFSSSTGNSGTWNIIDRYDSGDATEHDVARDIVVDSSGAIYCCGQKANSDKADWIVRKSHLTASSTWNTVQTTNSGSHDIPFKITVDKNDILYAAGYSVNTAGSASIRVEKSIDRGTTWTNVLIKDPPATTDLAIAFSVDVDSKNNVYVGGTTENASNDLRRGLCLFSPDGGSTWKTVDDYFYPSGSALGTQYRRLYVDSSDNIYLPGATATTIESGLFDRSGTAILRKGKLTANSASIGPRMLNPSFGYVYEEISGLTFERFKLNNISEFPHSEGMYQMKNIVLGTTDSGKVGKTDDSIVQVNHIGSFVKILWPKQDQDNFVKGFGDFAIGQKPGKLSTEWQPGEFIDVSKDNFDHVALYGYGLKETSGTLDSILIRVERRPLRNTGFTVEKVVEHIVSASFIESIYRDQIHRLDIDYGDLSIKEITWPVDIPLINTKELRISAKHKNGQSDDANKNWIVYGRFIRSKEEV